jgi:hypothetical protein
VATRRFPLLLGALLTAGSAFGAPPIARHANPLPAPASTRWLQEGGCRALDRPDELQCGPESAIGRLGCTRVYPKPALAGLAPASSVAECDFISFQPVAEGTYFRRLGIFTPAFERFVAATPAGLVVIHNAGELRSQFAPIESAAEALSYAVATTGLGTFFGFDRPARYRYYVKTLEETVVERDGDGYLVRNLMRYDVFGCGPHSAWLADVAVSRGGDVRELRRTRVFEDPKEDHLCVD